MKINGSYETTKKIEDEIKSNCVFTLVKSSDSPILEGQKEFPSSLVISTYEVYFDDHAAEYLKHDDIRLINCRSFYVTIRYDMRNNSGRIELQRPAMHFLYEYVPSLAGLMNCLFSEGYRQKMNIKELGYWETKS